LAPAAEWRPNGFGAPVYCSPLGSVNAFGGIFLHRRCPSPVSDGCSGPVFPVFEPVGRAHRNLGMGTLAVSRESVATAERHP